jgi:adenylate cyclase
MAREIERKFLLEKSPNGLRDCPAERIEQGYLAIAEQDEVRLRRADERRLLTAKRGAGEVREEVEVGLGEEPFEALWPLTEGRRLEKIRYRVPLEGGLSAEVDVYGGALEGLEVAEVEFDSAAASRNFQPPAWLGREITGESRYANQSLALNGAPSA